MGITGSTYVFDYYELNCGVWCLKDAWLLWKKKCFCRFFSESKVLLHFRDRESNTKPNLDF